MIRGSRRARRLERNHSKHKAVTLSLVSLMDIFTILVFFLLVNSTEVEELPSIRNVELPNSIAEARGQRSTILAITSDAILINDQAVLQLDQTIEGDSRILPALIAPLTAAAESERTLQRANGDADDIPLALTIMGDKAAPWPLLKRILASCAEAGYSEIALAVLQTTPKAAKP